MPKKILIVAFGFYPESHGVAQAAYRQALGLSEWGYSVIVITRTQSSEELPFEVIILHRKSDYQTYLQTTDAAIIFLHGWHNWASDWALPVLPVNAKTILVSHGTNHNARFGGWRGWAWWLRKRFQAFRFPPKLKKFDHFVFLSDTPEVQRMSDVVLAKKWGLNRYSVIPNGAHPALSEPILGNFRERIGVDSAPVLLCVSNFQLTKGQGDLVDWFLKLNLSNAVLVLIGSEFNAFSGQLKKRAGHKLDKRIFLFEKLSVSERHAAYKAADVFVSATYTEVQPLMLLDAMAAGVPYLCRKVGVVPELGGGLCFKDEPDFAEKLQWLLAHPSERKKWGEAGKAAVKEKYNWKRNAELYHQLIQQLLS
ncbi:MAG: glycosyltransferase family 4 protein [Spirosomataceae bacterium]